MPHLVKSVLGRCRERLAALGAHVRLLPRVDADVLLRIRVVRIVFPKGNALEIFLTPFPLSPQSGHYLRLAPRDYNSSSNPVH